MSGFLDKAKYEWRRSGIIFQIIVINVLIFIPLNLSRAFDWGLREYLVLPLDPSVFVHHPWTFITCMFSHEDFMHIFSNMIWFYMMGRIFITVTGFEHWTKMTYLYVMGGVVGNIFLFAFSLLLPRLFGATYALGASDGVMAVALAVGFFAPNYVVNLFLVGEVRIKWVVAFLFIISTLVDLSANTGGKVSHLGGAVFGAVYGLRLKRGKDISAWFTRLFSRKSRPVKMKVVHKRAVSDDEYNELRRDDERVLNDLLDKINKSGYDSLNKKEKETLHLLSRKK